MAFLEGPAWRSDGVLFFTDVPNNKIMKWAGQGPAKVHRTPSGQANGLVVDGEDNLLIAETAGRIVRERPDGTIDVLTAEYEGQRYNAPNDLAVDSGGRIYFTDTRYRNRDGATMRGADGTIIDAVYKIDLDGTVTRILNTEVDAPNGILVTPGDTHLIVADNNSRPGGRRRLLRFALDTGGNVKPNSAEVLQDFGTERGPDGMAIDVAGTIYVTAGLNHAMPGRTNAKYRAGIYVFRQDGTLLRSIPVPMDTTSNVTIGGANNKTLYITGGHTIWLADADAPGLRPGTTTP